MRFCIKATDAWGVSGNWASQSSSFAVVETLSYSFGGVTAVERIGAGVGESQVTYTLGNNVNSAHLAVTPNGATVVAMRALAAVCVLMDFQRILFYFRWRISAFFGCL